MDPEPASTVKHAGWPSLMAHPFIVDIMNIVMGYNKLPVEATWKPCSVCGYKRYLPGGMKCPCCD